MCYVRGSFLILALCLFSAANSICDYSDNECLTHSANETLQLMIPGIPGLLPPLDPLHEDRIEGETPNTKYVLTNVTLSGMKHCHVELLSINPKDLRYVYTLRCARFIVAGDYEAKGTLDITHIDHEGGFQVTLNDYIITFKGTHTHFVDENDNKLRLQMVVSQIESEPKGKVTFEDTFLRRGDEEKAEVVVARLNEHWQHGSKLLLPTIHSFLLQYIHMLNAYFKAVPVEHIFVN